MKVCADCQIEKPDADFLQLKTRLHSWCNDCRKKNKREWYVKNQKAELEKAKKYHYEQYNLIRDRKVEAAVRWQTENRDRYRENAKRCYEKTKERRFAYQAFSRAARRNAVPKWVDQDLKNEIQKFYLEARKRTEETGVAHEVDHIVPLVNEQVCGLHVPWNLRVVTQKENRIKHNKFQEG